MNKYFRSFLLFAILAILFAACSVDNTQTSPASDKPESVTESISLVDGLNREVTLENPAQKIVSLAPSNAELVYAVGAGYALVARDSFSDYPEAVLEVTDIGGGFAEYDLETILSLEPDLVLAAEINTEELVQSLEDLGLTVFYISNPKTFEDLFANIEDVGVLTGKASEAKTLAASLKERVDAVSELTDSLEEKPTLFYELDATDPTKPYTPGANTFYSTIITMAGGKNVGDALEADWAQISLEELLVQDPDFIILGDSIWGITAESVAEREGWDSLKAVINEKVLPFNDNLMARPGPRLVQGLEELAKVLHPDLFE